MRKLLAVGALLFIAVPVRAGGGTPSPYYLTNGDATILQVVDGNMIVNSWDTASVLYPIAVIDTVRLYNRGAGFFDDGIEYTLDGTPTGVTYPWHEGPTGQLLDGGTDGVAHNYASEWNDGQAIWQYDLNWSNPTMLFSSMTQIVGVTYDAADDLLWISLDGGNIQQVTLDGTVVSEFNPGNGRWGALAWEPITDTIWAHDNNGNSILRQWSKDGEVLQEVSVNGLSSNIWGGEFAIPAPSTWMLLAAGAIGVRRRRRS